MKVVLAYVSPNNTTRKVSRELGKLFAKDGHEVVELDLGKKEHWDGKNIDPEIFRGADLIGFGSPVFHLNILRPLSDFLSRDLPRIKQLNGKVKAFVYLTFGGVSTGQSFASMLGPLKRSHVEVVGGFKVRAPHFWHTEQFPYDETRKTIGDFYGALARKKFAAMEWGEVEKMHAGQKMIVRIACQLVGPVNKIRGMPAIRFDREKCNKCRKCYNECPLNAIEMKDYPVRNAEKCVYCYHCVMACPKHAVTYSLDEVERRIAGNKRIIGLEQPTNVIYA